MKSYLSIQEIRYAEIMEYSVEVPNELEAFPILKLVLQPLVENAIYHGIKPKSGKNIIQIKAEEYTDHQERRDIIFTVYDTGVGIEREKLKKINQWLKAGKTDSSNGYGIFNVNERIQLYYGIEYGLSYESEAGKWTKAILRIPKQEEGYRV